MRVRAIVGAGVSAVALSAAALAGAAPDDQSGDQPTTQPSAQPTSASATSQPSSTPPSTQSIPDPDAESTAETSAPPRDLAVVAKQFLRKLEFDELAYGTPETLLRDGLDVCQKASEGTSGPQLAEYITQKRGLDSSDSNQFAVDAVQYLCPQYIDRLTLPSDCGPFVC